MLALMSSLISSACNFVFCSVRLHCMLSVHKMCIYSYRQSSVFCMSVGHVHKPCKNGWTHRDADWRVDLGGPKEPSIRCGRDFRMGRDNFGGCRAHWNALGVSAMELYAAKKSVVVTAGLRQPRAMLRLVDVTLYCPPRTPYLMDYLSNLDETYTA